MLCVIEHCGSNVKSEDDVVKDGMEVLNVTTSHDLMKANAKTSPNERTNQIDTRVLSEMINIWVAYLCSFTLTNT